MIESIIASEKKCTEQIDILPDKTLRPIGTVFKEWIECLCSTDLPHWTWWEVVGYMKVWRGTGRYERCEEIQGIDKPE